MIFLFFFFKSTKISRFSTEQTSISKSNEARAPDRDRRKPCLEGREAVGKRRTELNNKNRLLIDCLSLYRIKKKTLKYGIK